MNLVEATSSLDLKDHSARYSRRVKRSVEKSDKYRNKLGDFYRYNMLVNSHRFNANQSVSPPASHRDTYLTG